MVDANRFDALAVSLLTATPTRRSFVSSVLAAGLAGLLAVFGLGESPDDVEAAKRQCRRRCRRKPTRRRRQRCLRRCQGGGGGGGGGNTQVSYDITINPAGFSVACPGGQGDCPANTTCVAEVCLDNCGPAGECPTGYTCSTPVCLPTDVVDGVTCQNGGACETGRCTGGVCALCPVVSICGPAGDEVCCTVDATCENNVCVLQDA